MTLLNMTLFELHEEGRRLNSPALLSLVNPIREMHPSEVAWLQHELRREAEANFAHAEALLAEKRLRAVK